MSNLNSNCPPPSPSSCDVKSSKSSVTEVSVKFDHFNAGRELLKILPHTGKKCGVFEIRDICKSTLDLHKFA